MPRGVSDRFLHLLQRERSLSLRHALVMLALAPLAYFMAELVDEPLWGPVVVLSTILLFVGLVAGALWGLWRTRHYNESIRHTWNAWMRKSLSCERIHEVSRAVDDKGRPPAVAGIGWGALLVANAVLFIALWMEAGWAFSFGVMVVVANALTLGALAGRALWTALWTSRFRRALDELVAEGQVGLWGER